VCECASRLASQSGQGMAQKKNPGVATGVYRSDWTID